MKETIPIKGLVWINGIYVPSKDFSFYEEKFEKLLGEASKKEEKRVLVNDLETKAIKAETFLFDDRGYCMGVLCYDFSNRVNIETLFFDHPLVENIMWPGLQFYRLGSIHKKGNIYIPDLIKSSTGEKLDNTIREILIR